MIGFLKLISFYFKGIVRFDSENNVLTEETGDHSADCRGLIESQALSYKLHSKRLGLDKISSLNVTGGGSVNREILQIVADVFECVRRQNHC